MSVVFSALIQKFIKLNQLDLSEIENLILENDFTPIQFCENCLDILVDLNFTGPVNVEIEANVTVPRELLNQINEDLICEGELPFLKTKGIILLWILKHLSDKLSKSSLNDLTRYQYFIVFLKSVYIHKSTLRDHVSKRLCNEVVEYLKMADDVIEVDCISEFQLSLLGSYLANDFYQYDLSEKLFNRCQELLGITTEFDGAFGKRTKFQQTDLSQLYMRVDRHEVASAREINDIIQSCATVNLPNDLILDDDLLLEEISFTDRAPVQRCSVAEQALLLLQYERHYRSHGKHPHVTEQCDAIIIAAIGAPRHRLSSWSIVTEALLARSRVTDQSSRQIDRSIRQLEQLSQQFSHVIPSAANQNRREWFFLSRAVSVWEMDIFYGDVLLKLGDVRSSLDVMQRWDQWSAIIDCHTRLGHRGRAVAAIRERLAAEGETAELLCCLGDATQERAHYERAWTVSKQRSARAMRSLAIHYLYTDRDHAKAAECFEKSLAQNVLQINTWFTYGHCCVQLKEYRKAAGAFKQCFTFEPDNYEAWCNCASALVELGEHHNALTFLKQAVKHSYNNWRVWDNVCIVSAQCGEYNTTIDAYNHVIDEQKQHRDPISLAKIVAAIVTDAANNEKFRAPLKKLLARIATVDGRDPRLFLLQAQLLDSDVDKSAEMRDRVLGCLSRSYHGWSQEGWQRTVAGCKRVMTSVLRLVDKSVEFRLDDSRARLAVGSVLAVLRARQSAELEPLDDEVMRLLSTLEEAEELLAAK